MAYKTQVEEVFAIADQGRFLERASAKLADVARAVDLTGKPGTFTVTFTVKNGARGQVYVTPKTTTKEPQVPVQDSLFFISDEGLSRTDPFQEALPLATPQLRITGDQH